MGRESSDVRNVFAKATSAIVMECCSWLISCCSFIYEYLDIRNRYCDVVDAFWCRRYMILLCRKRNEGCGGVRNTILLCAVFFYKSAVEG